MSMSSEAHLDDRAATPPPAVRDTRRELASELFRGSGLEIGALHLPMVLPAGVSVRYVDRMSVPDLRVHYPELDGQDLAPVDVVDDGELLSTIEPESVDFIVANHFLEHCEDPIRTIETHLGKLRSGGILFYAVPDKRYTFDFRRPRTPLGHVIADHDDGGRASRAEHYLEWARLVYPEGSDPPGEQAAREYAAELEATSYSIHFHVWTQSDLLEVVLHCQQRLESFEIEAVRRVGLENIVVLRKHGELDVKPVPAAEVARRRIGRALARAGSIVSGKIPLSALRFGLDEGSAHAHWTVDPDGVPGRSLVQTAGSVVSVPLRLSGSGRFAARARLLPHDWRDGVGAVRAWVAIVGADGVEHTLWSGTLPAAASRRHGPRGLPVVCELPASTAALKLGIDPRSSGTGPVVARAVWVEPEIADPSADLGASARPTRHAATLARGQEMSGRALISVLTPVRDPSLQMLEEAIASVRSQSFTDWELCLVDDCSTSPDIIAALRRHAASDSRIHLRRRDTAGGISAATNAALELATGKYIGLLDHDDTLAPDALERVADQLARQPDLDMIYSDEDIVMDGRQIWLHLKPGWSPDTLRTNGYTCHLGVYRRALVLEIGGFRSDFDGSQDVDMILRLVERTDRIAHIPHILYHWRVHSGSTAGGDAKPYAYVAARNAIAAHLERCGLDAEVGYGPPGLYRVAHRVDPSQSVALVLAVEDHQGLEEAARSWTSQPHPTWTVVLAAPERSLAACADTLYAAGLAESQLRTVITQTGWDRATALGRRCPSRDRRTSPPDANPCRRAYPRLADPPDRLQ